MQTNVRNQRNGNASNEKKADHWGQSVEHYDDRVIGAGERCECKRCGSSHIGLVAGTDPLECDSKWEEFYRCDCGAEGILRVTGVENRSWIGMVGEVGQ